ncbi:MAG: CAP domain-containing protein [Nitriliruptorales bacterium]|nr:CAP domain-containing protein [Nitriliruptorales bacterium]
MTTSPARSDRTGARQLGVVILLVLALLAAHAPSARAARDTGAEADFIRLINKSRAANGAAPLAPAADMATVAHAWSVTMATADKLFHNPDYTTQICCWQALAENVGYHSLTSSVGETVARLHSLFMESPGHRTNILNPVYNQVGVGVEIRDGIMWVTVNFRKGEAVAPEPEPEPEPEPAPEPEPEPAPAPKPKPTPKPEPAPEPAPAPPPAPEPDPEPTEEELAAATRTHAHLLLVRLEMLETPIGL